MKQMIIGLMLTTVIFVTPGCQTPQVARYETVARQSKPNDYDPEIVESLHETRSYKVIGTIQVLKKLFTSPDTTMYNLKQECRRLGGDALLDLTITEARRPVGATMYQAKVIIWMEK